MPGAPQRPDHREFSALMSKLAAERRALIEQIKELQSSIRGNGNRDAADQERNELRKRIGEIDELRKKEEELRVGKNDEIAKIRKQKHEINERLRALQTELGGFADHKDIEEAIRFIMVKMETSGGGLRAERRTMRRLHQLEEAKSLLLQRQPLTEAIEEAEEREVLLQQEYREIHERIGSLNKEYEDEYKNKQNKDKAVRATGAERAEVWRKCEQLRAKVNAISNEMDKHRAEHARITADWDAWCADARGKYSAKVEAEREARRQRYLAARNASKMDGKVERAKQRLHSHELEIGACDTLAAYLLEKKAKTMREAEERAKRAAAAAFDLNKAVPQGYVVLNESKWSKPSTSRARGKAVAQPTRASKPSTAAATSAGTAAVTAGSSDAQANAANTTTTTTTTNSAGTSSSNNNNNTANASASPEHGAVLQFTEDKMRLFQLINIEPPLSIAAIDSCVAAIRDKLTEYKTQASGTELELSSDESDDDGNGSNDGDATTTHEPTGDVDTAATTSNTGSVVAQAQESSAA